MAKLPAVELEDIVTATYCALDDALREAGIESCDGKLIRRRGPPPEIDDREVLCLAVLQELLGFESDNLFHEWVEGNATMKELFPKRLCRQNFAERRLVLAPLLERLCGAFCALVGDGRPPFSSSIAIPSMYAAPVGPN